MTADILSARLAPGRRGEEEKMKKNIALEEAQSLLLESGCPVSECHVPLFDALGSVLSRNVFAAINLPSFDKSALDGYVLQAKDTETATGSQPVTLSVIEEVAAGHVPEKQVTPGTAIKVMTGAPIPEGADVVIKFEDVERVGDSLKLFSPLKSGSNIILAGEDVAKGEIAAWQNTLIVPALVGLFAALGYSEVPVFSKVKVAIASTGDELLDPAQQLQPGKIYNSNLHSLTAACFKLGTRVVALGNVPDRQDLVADKISQGLAEADIVITTGGVSVGDYDVVPDALAQIGADIIFRGVNIKPGSPVIAAKKDNKFIVCLSGNPAAALITFELLVVPLIKKMMGLDRHFPTKTRAILADDFVKPSPQRRFLRGHFHIAKDSNYVTLTGGQSNGILKSMVDCNALIDVPAGSNRIRAGQDVSVLIVGECYGQ
jgi:molybdopterin molybdotransferase